MNFPDPNLPPIVIVDDCQDDAFLLRHRLRLGEVSHPVVTFDKPNAALAHLKSLQLIGTAPWMLFTDLRMPGGLELIATTRMNPDFNDTKVVVLTYSNDPIDLKRALELQVDGYLLKFPDPDFLGEFVRRGPWFTAPLRIKAPVAAAHALCA